MLTALLLIRYEVTQGGKGLNKLEEKKKRGKNSKVLLYTFHKQEISEQNREVGMKVATEQKYRFILSN
jgi:hypothetical protein